jgi:hypothetical protein
MNIQSTMSTTETRKIGRNRGKPRLWLEGQILTSAGFAHRQAWILMPHLDGITLQAIGSDEEADGRRVRKVSGTAGRPVIDIAGASLAQLAFTGGEPWDSVSLTYEPGSGRIDVGLNPSYPG